jgi:hypothetical protein
MHSLFTALRQNYQQEVCQQAIFLKSGDIPSIADVSSLISKRLSRGILERIGADVSVLPVKGQTAGKRFEDVTLTFLQQSFALLYHLRPGQWQFTVQGDIAAFAQYKHMAELSELIKTSRELRTVLGDYMVKPDIIISRLPVQDNEINQEQTIVAPDQHPFYTPMRGRNNQTPILHASISCKLTLRSDRSQNARTESLNLIRNRKGHTPHIVVVTAEPMPSRIASLALGTGDLDCVYHFALHELMDTVNDLHDESAADSLNIMVNGGRLRDIADLPFDLVA